MNGNILIVDDLPQNIQVLGSILGKADYAVSFATSGGRALEMIATEVFDLILLDIMMPEMDGFEVCRRIQQTPANADLPIIFLTAKSEKQDVIQGLQAGAVDYVTKPFSTPELLARVKTHVDLKKTRQALVEHQQAIEAHNRRLTALNQELSETIERLKTLEGMIPICSVCKSIRDPKGYWNQLEAYLLKYANVNFTHGICPTCIKKHYPELNGALKK